MGNKAIRFWLSVSAWVQQPACPEQRTVWEEAPGHQLILFHYCQDFTLITDNNKKGRGRIRSNLGEEKGFNRSRCHCSTGKVLDSILWCLLGRSLHTILESILLRCQESQSGLIYPSWMYFGMAQEACTCHKNCTLMYMKEFEMPDSVRYKFCAGSLWFFFFFFYWTNFLFLHACFLRAVLQDTLSFCFHLWTQRLQTGHHKAISSLKTTLT